jgi:hypothetical protein
VVAAVRIFDWRTSLVEITALKILSHCVRNNRLEKARLLLKKILVTFSNGKKCVLKDPRGSWSKDTNA